MIISFVSLLKKSIPILLIVVLAYNLAGYFVAFNFMINRARLEVKQAIKKNIPESDLILITVSINDTENIQWIKPGKEFRYLGKMYDVVRTAAENNLTHYYCIDDLQESRLFANLDEHVKNHINQGNASSGNEKNILKNTLQDYCTENRFNFIGFYGSDFRPNECSAFLSSPFPEITAPPPKQG